MKYTDEQKAIINTCRKYKGVKVEFGIEKFCIYTNDGGHKFSLTDNVSEIEEWLKTNCELMQDCTPKGKSFFECVCYYCGKGCEEPSPNCGRLSEIKFSLQDCDRVKFLADNFTYQEFENAKKMQSEIRCKKIKETICYNCTYNIEKCCDRGIDLRSISDTCRYKQEINILPF